MQHHCDQFIESAKALSAEIHEAKNEQEVSSILTSLISSELGNRIGIAKSPLLDRIGKEIVGNKTLVTGVDLYKSPETVDIGVSEVDIGVAETGSLGQKAEEIDKRLVSTLPNLHIAILKKSTICASIVDAMAIAEQWVKQEEPSYIAFISGPSRTADIERVLTIGVHGPERLIIIIVDDQGGQIHG